MCVSFPEENEVKVFNEKGREKTWEFDEVFNTESSQEQVYREVSDLVTSVLDGYNICIFAYVSVITLSLQKYLKYFLV